MTGLELPERVPYRTWYRSLTPDGAVWCESTDPDEVVRMSAGRKGLRYEKSVVELVTTESDWDGKL